MVDTFRGANNCFGIYHKEPKQSVDFCQIAKKLLEINDWRARLSPWLPGGE